MRMDRLATRPTYSKELVSAVRMVVERARFVAGDGPPCWRARSDAQSLPICRAWAACLARQVGLGLGVRVILDRMRQTRARLWSAPRA